MLIAITASKHFNCNTFIAVWCCLALVNPDWTSMAARIAGGESIQFIIFNMAETTYTSTVLPPLFLVLVPSYLERFLNKVVPDIIKALAVPFICAVIMVPATIPSRPSRPAPSSPRRPRASACSSRAAARIPKMWRSRRA